ncbi:MAG: Ig-like domain-containing protein [Muribaculaceae bacterium]|nr:Ig-like domain-containing protein [Muribaculaceae bacterium]
MKKLLLTFATLAMGVTSTLADETKMVFDGDNDMGGLTRQTDFDPRLIRMNPGDLVFSDSFTYAQDGVEFSIKKESEEGYGFALVNAGGTNAGIMVYSTMVGEYDTILPEVTLSIPNGKIKGFKLVMTGDALGTLEIEVEGKKVESVSENNAYSWTWSDEEGLEKVTFDWENKFHTRYIHSIEITYTPDLGGKKECGLSFNEDSAEVILGQDFTLPTLSNPNNLPIVWSSTNESVATVDAKGVVTLVGGGETSIIASTEGNDAYAAGNVKYLLKVVPVATSLLQMKEFAPNLYDKVYVNFPMTVTFPNMGYAFVIDAEGTAGYIQNIVNQNSSATSAVTIYKVGDIIPAGWVATNANLTSEWLWEGKPEKSTETTEVTYPVVESVTPADCNMVVILKNVKFTTFTATGNTKAFGTTPDGTRYEFQDNYNAPAEPAGEYDVTGVVRYSTYGASEFFYISPIAYKKSEESGIENIAVNESETRYFNLQGMEVENPANGVYVKVSNGKVSKVIIK